MQFPIISTLLLMAEILQSHLTPPGWHYFRVKNFRVKHHNAILACVAAVSHISNHFSNIVYLNPNRRVSGSELTDKDRVATAKDLKISSAEEPKFILISD